MARGSKSKDVSLAQALGQFLERTLIPDLRLRVEESPSVKRALDDALARERAEGRTADDPIAYRERTLEQVGAAWLLDCVFVRFLEDRGFVAHRRLAGDGAVDAQERFGAAFPGLAGNAREYLLAVFREVGNLPGVRELLGARNDVARRLGPSAGVAGDLLRLLREELADKRLRWRFDSDDTRVLGDLYQDLSAAVRERYALLQTPDFVESFILDHTLDPAVKEFGLDGFRMIDPTCGSGHFVLGAFHRLRALHERKDPSGDAKQHAGAALQHVFGVDLNPFAVAITRFRLLVAYLGAAGIRRLREAPADLELDRHVVVADSLLYGGKNPSLAESLTDNTARRALGGDHFVLEDPVAGRGVFGSGYHAVVGNPPYIVCRDAALREVYRARYPDSAKGKYALAAPFTERFFELGIDGGFVGLINANSFMKREFGKSLVEKVLTRLDLTGVIDTSGAFIPGHGTPTVILFGRNQRRKTDTVRAVLGRRGEPETPGNPAKGKVWSSISDHVGDVAFENDFVTVADLSRETLARHPWSLGGGGAGELKEHIEERCDRRLDTIANSIGISSVTGEDDVYVLPRTTMDRLGVKYRRPLLTGELLRDWSAAESEECLFPYDDAYALLAFNDLGDESKLLWSARSIISHRRRFGVPMIQRGAVWYELQELYRDKLRTPLTITFAEVATHNHFVLDRGGKVFKQTAPIIKLSATATEDDHLALLAWLNSSTVCFWMKQVCMNKGAQGVNEGFKSEYWEQFHQFGATKLGPLPVPTAAFALQAGRALNGNAQVLAGYTPTLQFRATESGQQTPLADRLSWARECALSTQETMVAQQEELDWRWYEHLGLLTDDERTKHAAAREAAIEDEIIPPFPVGLRAFERAMFLSGESTAWFERNGYLVPTDPVMARLSAAMQRLNEVRIEIIQSNRFIGLIERPEYKRRWTKRDWNEEVRDAATTALLDAVEAIAKEDVVVQSLRALASAALRDPRVHAIAELRFPGEDDLGRALAALVEAESVAFLTAWRFTDSGLEKRARWETTWALQRREDAGETLEEAIPVPPKYDREDYREPRYWSLRGKLDVPRERFIGYPGATTDDDPSPLYGWAGWDHRQRAEALTALYLRRKDEDGWTAERLVPLLAGLDELVPWLKQWHGAPQPGEDLGAGDAYDAFVETELHALGITRAQVRGWRPPEKRAGRAAAKAKAVATEEGAGEAASPKKRGRPKKGAAKGVEP